MVFGRLRKGLSGFSPACRRSGYVHEVTSTFRQVGIPSHRRCADKLLGTSPPLTEVSRARNAEKVLTMSPGASGAGPRKVTKKSREQFKNTLLTLSGDSPSRHFPDCSRDCLETFGGSGTGGSLRHVRSGPEGPRDLCKGRAGSQTN